MFYDIKIEDLDGMTNKFNRILTSSCFFCNAEATRLLTRTSEMSDKTYTDRVCKVCANKWKSV